MDKTPFVETEALLAIQDRDYLKARKILNSMSILEIRTFRLQLSKLRNLCADVINTKIDEQDGVDWSQFKEE